MKTEQIHIFCTKEEKEEIKRRAEKENRTVSNYLIYIATK